MVDFGQLVLIVGKNGGCVIAMVLLNGSGAKNALFNTVLVVDNFPW